MNLYKGSISGFGFPVNANAPNKFKVVLNVAEITPEIIANAQANYNVIETDYKNYALVFTCENENYLGFVPVRRQYAFVLARQRKIDNLTELINKFSAYVDTSRFTIDDQNNC